MFGFKTIFRCLLAFSIGLCVLCLRETEAAADTTQPVAIHFAFDGPLESSMAPFFMAAKDGRFGYQMEIIVQADGPIKTPADIKGRTMAFSAPTSNSGFKAPAGESIAIITS